MRKRRLQLAFTPFIVLMLLVQLMLTAGHVHFHGPAGVHTLVTQAPHGAGDPARQPPGDDADHCALCWAQAAAGNLLVPPVLALPLPTVFPAAPLAVLSQHLTDSAVPRGFRPRAPPSVLA